MDIKGLAGGQAPLEGGLTRYISTRGEAPVLGFCDVMLTGLARDGGLYVPETWPLLSPETIAGFFGRPYWEVAVDVIRPFVGGEISDADLGRMANEAYATFRHPAVVPLDRPAPSIRARAVSRPDAGVQGRRDAADLAADGSRAGEARAAHHHRGRNLRRYRGCRGRCVRGPRECRSDRAVSAWTYFGRAAADDDDDRCRQRSRPRRRRHLRRLPGDREGAVQSSRLSRRGLAVGRQFHQLGADRRPGGVLFHLRGRARRAVAAGRFHGADREFRRHLCGLVAKRMGLPVRWLRIAANVNDILPRTLKTGIYEVREVHATASPSMDIQVSSNFERLLFEASRRDAGSGSPADGVAEAVRTLRAAGRGAC